MSKQDSDQYSPDLNFEYITGDQPYKYRKRRGARRYPNWRDVEAWRKRWTSEKVALVLELLGQRESVDTIEKKTGFKKISIMDVHGASHYVPDLRGLDIILLPPEKRSLAKTKKSLNNDPLDLSYARLEGARLTGLDLSNSKLYRAHLQKATLRRTIFKNSILTKAHLEDADLREADLEGSSLSHIRYTENGFWWRGTVLMETNLGRSMYVDPLLERCAKDQYYLYVLKDRNKRNVFIRALYFLWWITCNFGKSPLLWATWSIILTVFFAFIFFLLGEGSFIISNLKWSFSTLLYYSVVTFTTLGFGDVTPKTQAAAWWVMAEVIVGYLMLGGLISILSTKIARRS